MLPNGFGEDITDRLDEPARSIIQAVDDTYTRKEISTEEASKLCKSVPEYTQLIDGLSMKDKLQRYRKFIEPAEE